MTHRLQQRECHISATSGTSGWTEVKHLSYILLENRTAWVGSETLQMLISLPVCQSGKYPKNQGSRIPFLNYLNHKLFPGGKDFFDSLEKLTFFSLIFSTHWCVFH